MSGQYKVSRLCDALLVSRSGYYDWLHRRHTPGARQRENLELRQRIRLEFERSRQTYGGRSDGVRPQPATLVANY